MLPWIHFGPALQVHTGFALTVLYAVLAAVVFRRALSGYLSAVRSVAIAVTTAAAALFGGRLFHVVWERPEHFLQHPGEAFSRFDGMVFYGALAAGLVMFALLVRGLDVPTRRRAWDVGAVIVALGYGVLRLGCFASGCCWGTLTSVPWAVTFLRPDAATPILGLPLHPVQLYDSMFGFTAGIVLRRLLKRRTHDGLLMPIFLASYAGFRIFSEMFRGDSFRRADVLSGFSTSQVISAVILLMLGVVLLRARTSKSLLTALAVSLSGAGCAVPQPPGSWVIERTESRGSVEVVTFAKDERPRPPRQVIFAALDDSIQGAFKDQLAYYYPDWETPPRIEDIAWWLYAPFLQKSYDRAFRINVDSLNGPTLTDTILNAEASGIPYDVILLTHGLPNHIAAAPGRPMISWKDIGALSGLRGLGYVFMQSCYGSSLAPDWAAAGAKQVIAFSGLNRNFFWFGFFLERLAHGESVPIAFVSTEKGLKQELKSNRLLRFTLKAIGLSLEQYLQNADPPLLFQN